MNALTGDASNMITDNNGDILWYRYSTNTSNVTSGIKKWTNSPLATGGIKTFYFTTKDFTFGDISVKKNLYKVYLTYRVATDGTDSGVAVKGAVNGTNTFDVTFSASTSTKYGSSTLDETDGKWATAILKFSTPSNVKKIYSFQLEFQSAVVAADFEINDISIVYRTFGTR